MRRAQNAITRSSNSSIFSWISLLLILFLVACGGDGENAGADLNLSITVSPEAGFVPAEIEFSAVLDDDTVSTEGLSISWSFGDGATSTGSFTVSHIFDQVGTYTVTVSVEGNAGQGTATVDIDVYPQADLRGSPPFLDQLAVRSQDDLRVSFDLFNDASEVPVPFTTGIYLSEQLALDHDTPPDPDTLLDLTQQSVVYLIATVSFDSFGGEGTQEALDITGIRVPDHVPSGIYEAFIYVDDTGLVGEFDEYNNVQFSSATLEFINTANEGPDLGVDTISARPSRSNVLEVVTADIDIINYGSEPTGDFEYNIYLSYANQTLDDSDVLLGNGTITGLAAGFEQELEDLTFELAEPVLIIGDYYVLAEVDSTGEVEETNESNNIGVSNVMIVTDDPIPGTDIIPLDFSFDPLTSFLDGSITLTANVINQGSEATPQQFFCRVYLSEDDDLDIESGEDVLLDTFNYPVLGANEELEMERISLIPGFFQPGIYDVFIFCDPNYVIPEADEDNNVLRAEGRLEISTDPEIDLSFGSVDISPNTLENGDDLTITMEICNEGTNGAGPSLTQVRMSPDPILDDNDTILLDFTVSGVDAGTCVTVQEVVPAVCDTFISIYSVFFTLDVTDLLPETGEDNNQEVLTSPLTIQGVYCICQVDPLEADNDSPATPTFISASEYCDLSMCDSNVDWYAIPLQAGETVRVVTTFDSTRGNLDLTLFDDDRATELDHSDSDGDIEEVLAFVVPDTGDYLIKVAGRDATDVNVYCMDVEVTPPVEGTDLLVGDVTLSDSEPVLGETIEVSFDVYNLGDVDAEMNTVRIYLSDDIDIDPAVDELLTELVLDFGVTASSKVSRTIEVEMPAFGDGGNRYLGVFADALNDVPGELDETNNIGLSSLFFLDAGCYDALEPNNELDSATSLELTSDVSNIPDLLVCSDNNDFYEICVDTGDFLLMTVRFDTMVGDIDLRLYEEGGDIIARAEGTTDEEILEIDYVAASQCYTLEVLVIGSGREVIYDMTIETGTAPDELLCSGAAEPNDSFASAVELIDILDPVFFDLAICPESDLDFYYFTANAGSTVTINLIPGEGDEALPDDLRMSLWDRTFSFITNTVSSTEPIIYSVTTTGRHYLRVMADAGGQRNQRYQLEILGLDGIDLNIVDFEIYPATAFPGERVEANFTIENSRIGDSDPFLYGIFFSDDAVIEIDTDQLLFEGSVDSGLDGGDSIIMGDRVWLPEDAEGGELYFMGIALDHEEDVDEYEESNNIAVLPMYIESSCEMDSAEPNDARIDAVDFADYVGLDLTLCSDDSDWFTYEIESFSSYFISAEFESTSGDLDIMIWDEDYNLLAVGDSTSLTGESVSLSTEAMDGAETVYVQIVPWDVTVLEYTLTD